MALANSSFDVFKREREAKSYRETEGHIGIVDSLLTGQITPYATIAEKGGDKSVMDGDTMLASGTYAFSELIND
jgi:hypothetical protein